MAKRPRREMDIPPEESVHVCFEAKDIVPAGRTCSWPLAAIRRHVSSDGVGF